MVYKLGFLSLALQMRLIRPLPSIDVVKDRRDRLLVEEVSAAAQQLMRTPGQPAESQALPDTDYNTD